MKCDSCQMLMINGVPCHETGCPNTGKEWNGEDWVTPTPDEDDDVYDDLVDGDLPPAVLHHNDIEEAKRRGRAAGLARRAEVDDLNNLPDWSPLSGEWAGESIPELLGDLLPDGYQDEEIVDAYEEAALEAYQQEDNT